MKRFSLACFLFCLFTYSYLSAQSDLVFTDLSKGVKKANIKSTSLGEVNKYAYQASGENTDISFWNGNRRGLFLMVGKNDEMICVWQDQTSNAIYLNIISTSLQTLKIMKLANLKDSKLVSACIDENGSINYLSILDRAQGDVVAEMRKSDITGKELLKKSYDCSIAGLDIWMQGSYMSDMECSNGTIGLLIARRMFSSGDGLNHQGGIACVFNSATLELVQNFGQTSGHSFDNYLSKTTDGKFLALDLGDNYPRGVNLHKFSDANGMQSRVVFTYKTEHGTSPGYTSQYNYPLYKEISTNDKKYYKWSNDNQTYSELGGVVEVEDGYLVFFIAEPDPNGKSLDNGRAGSDSPDPRNIGFVKVRKDFEKAEYVSSNVVTDDLILSKGISEDGGFFDFGGNWDKQRNTGVNWLTSYKDISLNGATNLKTCALPNNETLLAWAYNGHSYAMKVNSAGKVISELVDLGTDVPLSRRDEMILLGKSVLIPMGNNEQKTLELVTIELK